MLTQQRYFFSILFPFFSFLSISRHKSIFNSLLQSAVSTTTLIFPKSIFEILFPNLHQLSFSSTPLVILLAIAGTVSIHRHRQDLKLPLSFLHLRKIASYASLVTYFITYEIPSAQVICCSVILLNMLAQVQLA